MHTLKHGGCSLCQTRSFAAVLLRKIAFKTTKKADDGLLIWEGSAEATREQVKSLLLEGYEKEAVVAVRNQLCDTIADVARDAEEKSSTGHLNRTKEGSGADYV